MVLRHITLSRSLARAPNVLPAPGRSTRSVELKGGLCGQRLAALGRFDHARERRERRVDARVRGGIELDLLAVPRAAHGDAHPGQAVGGAAQGRRARLRGHRRRLRRAGHHHGFVAQLLRKAAEASGWEEVAEGKENSFHVFWTDLSVSHPRVKALAPLQRINHFPDMTRICHKADGALVLKSLCARAALATHARARTHQSTGRARACTRVS